MNGLYWKFLMCIMEIELGTHLCITDVLVVVDV